MKEKINFLKSVYSDWFLIRIQVYEMLLCIIVFGGFSYPLFRDILNSFIFGSAIGTISIILMLIARYFSIKEMETKSKSE